MFERLSEALSDTPLIALLSRAPPRAQCSSSGRILHLGGFPLKFEKTIRDPIHGLIRVTEDDRRVIDTAVFQRLRRIKQLALTNYVFPGALHTRFEHSLGALETAYRMTERLSEVGVEVEDRDRKILRCAALLHDIGHGPFSHAAENFFEFPVEDGKSLGHEKASVDLIRNHPDLEFLGEIGEAAAALLEVWKGPRTFIRDIVSSTLDADTTLACGMD